MKKRGWRLEIEGGRKVKRKERELKEGKRGKGEVSVECRMERGEEKYLCRPRNFLLRELCSIFLREGLSCSKPATNP
jgi:hypothetical protein